MMNIRLPYKQLPGTFSEMASKKENIEAEHVKRVIQVCAMIAVIVDNALADVLANS